MTLTSDDLKQLRSDASPGLDGSPGDERLARLLARYDGLVTKVIKLHELERDMLLGGRSGELQPWRVRLHVILDHEDEE